MSPGAAPGENARTPKRYGLRWYWAWGPVGLISLFSLGAFPLGPLIALPLAGFFGAFLSRRARLWPEILGVANGPAFWLLLSGFELQRNPVRPCPEPVDPYCVSPSASKYLILGLVVAVGALLAYVVVSYFLRPSNDGGSTPVEN